MFLFSTRRMGLRESAAAGPSLQKCFGTNRCKTRVRKTSTSYSPAGDCLPPPSSQSWQWPRLRIDCRPGRPPKLSALQQSCSALPLPPLTGPGNPRAAPAPHRVRHETQPCDSCSEAEGAWEDCGWWRLTDAADFVAGRPQWTKWPKCTVLVPGPRSASQLLNCHLPEGGSLAV